LKVDEKDRVIGRTKEEFSAAMTTAQIHLRTDNPGRYQYEFTHLSDAVYDDAKNLGNKILLEHQVLPLPTAKFSDTQEPYVYCAETSFDNPKLNGIPITISASSPVTIKLEVRHETQRDTEIIQLTDITDKVYYFMPTPKSLTHGLHIITIVSIRDANGCKTQPTENNRASYAIADEASIIPVEPQQHHCVGDRISYSLQGTSPWQIEYEFNGERNSARTVNPTFSRIAERMGNLSIISVADRASACKTFIPPGKMEKFIHDVPSVIISGSNIVENIREGILILTSPAPLIPPSFPLLLLCLSAFVLGADDCGRRASRDQVRIVWRSAIQHDYSCFSRRRQKAQKAKVDANAYHR
jgi:nucleoporin POM152